MYVAMPTRIESLFSQPVVLQARVRRGLIVYGILVSAAISLGAGRSLAAEPPARPNVVLIVADDLGGADLGCYGSTFFKTPNLDKLARDGKRFTQGYAACCVCSPTRAALLTGKHPARLHITDWLPGRIDMPSQMLARPVIRQELPLEEITLAESLKGAGYATALIGKWHLGGEGFEPTRQGFDLNIGGYHHGAPASFFAPYGRPGPDMPGLKNAPPGEYLTDRLTDEAERFITAHRAEPFFLYLAHYAPHTPMMGKEELVAHYPAWDGTPHGRQENPIYAAMIESLDQSVGRVAAKLEELGLRERTLIIFTSDNGGLATIEGPHTPATCNAPLREGKGWMYEGGSRVPLIFNWPTHISPGDVATPAWSCDVCPTVLHACNAQQPTAVDGMNIGPLLTGGGQLPPRSLYWHYPHYSNQGGRPAGAVRDGDWKLIEFYENDRRELFDLARDPRESTNLADKYPERVAELAARLAAWRSTVDAQMPTPKPDYVPNPQAADGSITLPARTAEVQGVMLRYEPLPHKNTLGYWTRTDDWARWEFEVLTPGTFRVEALIGCGPGSGGSQVEFRFGPQVLTHTVVETGGFQQFVPCDLGIVTIDQPGRHTLEVRPRSKPGGAVMDLRQVKLTLPKG
jgi:arylsulfatase A